MPTGNDTVVRRTWPPRAPTLPLVLPLLLSGTVLAAPPALTPETRQVLVDAVAAAAALDFYNARCRSDDSGRNSDNLNKQLVNKLRLTIVTVEDELFPERNFRAAQRRLLEQSAQSLRDAGGCKPAKDAGLAEQLTSRYRQGVAAIEALP